MADPRDSGELQLLVEHRERHRRAIGVLKKDAGLPGVAARLAKHAKEIDRYTSLIEVGLGHAEGK